MINISYKGSPKGLMKHLDKIELEKCLHECISNCRREGCNCLCGEYHCDDCQGIGIIAKDEWVEPNESYEVEIKCQCREE